jgi:hypothetical protein
MKNKKNDKSDFAAKLDELRELHDSGKITEDDYRERFWVLLAQQGITPNQLDSEPPVNDQVH